MRDATTTEKTAWGERLRAWTPWILGLWTMVIFSPAIRFGFLNLDDPQFFLDNPYYRGLGFSQLRWMFTTFFHHYTPLSWVTLGLDYTLYGMNPHGYHATSLFIHGCNAVLLTYLFRHFLEDEWAVVAAVLFWAVHPLRVESVIWIAERKDLLSGLFFIATLLAYVKNSPRWMVVFYAGCLLTKASAIGLPLVLIIYEVPYVRWREKMPLFISAFICGAVTFWGQKREGAVISMIFLSLKERLVLSVSNLFFYVQKTICPSGLSGFYEIHPPARLGQNPYLINWIGALSVTLLAILWHKKAPWFWKGWLAFAILSAPVLGFVQNGGQMAADRYMYLPGIFLALGVGLCVQSFPRCRQRLAVIGVVVGLLTLGTRRQIQVWSSDESFISQILKVDPNSSFGNNNWGAMLASQGHLDEAIPYFERSVTSNPRNKEAAHNLSRAQEILHRSGRKMS